MNERWKKTKKSISSVVAAIIFISAFIAPGNVFISSQNTVVSEPLGISVNFQKNDELTAYAPAPGAYQVKELVPMGNTVGIKLYSDGLMVVGISEIKTREGERRPAGECGLKKGDIITRINSEKIDSTEEFLGLIQKSNGGCMSMQITRGRNTVDLKVTPVKSENDGCYKIGAWVRDSMAGIGTLTFYDPQTGVFGALGHGINDVDTLMLMPMSSGAIMHSTITAIKKGAEGQPGQLQGLFSLNDNMGKLFANTSSGVFGTFADSNLFKDAKAVPVGSRKDVKVGDVVILSNIYGDKVCEYNIKIEKVYPQSKGNNKNMLICITDERLLEATGGIVQGMSGSPIIQDGKIIGAVTHVLIDNPTKGYGIMIDNMISVAFPLEGKAA